MNSEMPKWMQMNHPPAGGHAKKKKKKPASKPKPASSYVTKGGMVQKGKKKAYLDSL